MQATRFEPEVFVPPLPGEEVRKATGAERDDGAAVLTDARPGSRRACPATTSPSTSTSSSSTAPAAPTSTSAASRAWPPRPATPRSCSTACSTPGVLGAEAANTKALIFNVKGEDLLFLDHPNVRPRRRPASPLRPARAAGRAVRFGRRLRPAGAATTPTPAPTSPPASAASRRSSGPSRSSAATSCCRSCSPTPRTTASSTRWSCTTSTARLRHAEPVGDGGGQRRRPGRAHASTTWSSSSSSRSTPTAPT